jgi:hypothetical protein
MTITAILPNLPIDAHDDARFIRIVDELVRGAVGRHHPAEVYAFKIDQWFDHKWLSFSGKVVGAVGSWRAPLTVPPFVANRRIGQWRFVRDDVSGTYRLAGKAAQVHHHGPSSGNLRRTVKRIVPTAALFWYSGATAATGRGSVMGYIPIANEHWPWYIGFDRLDDWRVTRRKGIHEYEIRLFREAAEAAL